MEIIKCCGEGMLTIQHRPRFYQSSCGWDGRRMGIFSDFSLFIDTSFGSMDMSHVGLYCSKWCSMLKPLTSFCCGSFLALFSVFLLGKLSLAGWRRASCA